MSDVAGDLDWQALVLDGLLKVWGELQESESLGHPGTGLSKGTGDRTLRAMYFHEAFQRFGLVQRIKALVLDGCCEGRLQKGVGAFRERVVDVDGHVIQACQVCARQATVSVDDDVRGRSEFGVVSGVCAEECRTGHDGEGLDDASRGEAVCHVLNGSELFPGIERVMS